MPDPGSWRVEEGAGGIELVNGYTPKQNQELMHQSESRFRVLVSGVKGGKTEAGAQEMIERVLASEEGEVFWVCGPTYPMLKHAERVFFRVLEPIYRTVVRSRNRMDRNVVFGNGAMVEFRSCDWADGLRGPSLTGVWIDEASFVSGEAMRVLRTRVSDTGGWILVTTTPKGKNWVWTWFLRGRPELNGVRKYREYWSHRYTTEQGGLVPKSEIEEARKTLPQDFYRQEYLAEFLDNAAGVFRAIDEIVCDSIPTGGKEIVLGLDLGKKKDFTVAVAMNEAGDVIDFDRIRKRDWVEQKNRIRAMAVKWDLTIWMDTSGPGDPIHDELVGMGLKVVGYSFTSDSKRRLVQALQIAIENRQVRIPPIQVMVDELKWYEYKTLASGRLRYGAPAESHDDCVDALMLANWGRVQEIGRASCRERV